GRGHPTERADVLPEGGIEVGDERLHVGLGFGGKGGLDVELAEGFAEVLIGRGDAALPAVFDDFLAGEVGAVEVEVGVHEGFGEGGGGGVDEVPAQVGFPIRQRGRGQLGVEGAEEAGRNHVHVGEGGRAGGGEEVGPLELGRERFELGERHLVVDGVGVAAGDVIHRALRQCGLDAQDGGGFGGGLGGGVAEEGEHFLDVGDVLLAQRNGFGVGLEVVVAIGKAQSALV